MPPLRMQPGGRGYPEAEPGEPPPPKPQRRKKGGGITRYKRARRYLGGRMPADGGLFPCRGPPTFFPPLVRPRICDRSRTGEGGHSEPHPTAQTEGYIASTKTTNLNQFPFSGGQRKGATISLNTRSQDSRATHSAVAVRLGFR
jgi:hypothetical protein